MDKLNVAPEFRSLWDGLWAGVPMLWADDSTGASDWMPLTTYGAPGIEARMWGEDQWAKVVTPFGAGFEYVGGSVDEGIRIGPDSAAGEHASYLNLKGDVPNTAAVLFKWDGTTGDQRAILSQLNSGDGANSLRVRLSNVASPANVVNQTNTVFPAGVQAGRWYMYVQRAESDFALDNQHDHLLYDYTDLTFLHDVPASGAGRFGFENAIHVGSQPVNDPATGVTFAGAWFWERRLGGIAADTTTREIEGELATFLADPFGMFRFYPEATSAPPPILQYIYPDGDVLGLGWDSAPTGGQPLYQQIDETTLDLADYIFEE